MTDCSGLGLDLEGCSSCFVSDDVMLVVLRSGECVTVEMVGGDAGSGKRKRAGVQGFMVKELGFRVGACSGAVSVGKRDVGVDGCLQIGFLFLQSWSAESTLLQFFENERRSDGVSVDAMDEDDDDIYGVVVREVTDTVIKPHFQFRVCDTLAVVAPLKDLCVSKSSNYSSFAFESGEEMELVACAGDEKQGYLSVLQRNIRPTILMSFDMDGIVGFWTIKFASSEMHSFVLLTTETSSTVLVTNEDLEETQTGGFKRAVKTLYASVFLGEKILQVWEGGAIVLADDGVLESEWMSGDDKIRKCCVAGEVCFLEMMDGSGRVLGYESKQLKINMEFRVDAVVSACLYEDVSGFFGGTIDAKSYLVVLDEDHRINFYDMQKLSVVYSILDIVELGATLNDGVKAREGGEPAEIEEILVAGLGSFSFVPHLIVRTREGDLVVYKCFRERIGDVAMDGRLAAGWVKLLHDISGRHAITDVAKTRASAMAVVRGVGGYSGVFISGAQPSFLMNATPKREVYTLEDALAVKLTDVDSHGHSSLYLHPMTLDGPISHLAEFSNLNCSRGFIYLTAKGALRFCTLPEHFEYEGDRPYAKIPMHELMPERCVYHYGADVVVVSCKRDAEFVLARAQWNAGVAANVIEADDVGAVPTSEPRDKGMFYPTVSEYSAVIVSPVTWEVVDRVNMLENEQILAMQIVLLDSKQTQSGKKAFLAVGTGFLRGEDLSTRGRLLLYDIIDVVPEIDNPQTCHKFKLLNTYDEKGPISAINCCKGNLIVAIGAKIIAYEYDDEKLTGVAFIDTTFYVTEIKVAKNMISLFDVLKSVWFVVFQEEPAKLQLLGKDYYDLAVYTGDFIVDDSFMSILAADADGNVHIYQYLPDNAESQNGNKLLRKGEFHTGSQITKMISMRSKTTDSTYFSLAAAVDGSLHAFIPISEARYNRLYALYSRMVTSTQHCCGLNPREFRQGRFVVKQAPGAFTGSYLGMSGPRGVIDGEFVWQFTKMEARERDEICKGIGSDVALVMEDLVDVMRGIAYF